MKITYDPDKNTRNIHKHGLPLEAAKLFEWETAISRRDSRYDYGEVRIIALGYVQERLCILCYTRRDREIRVISLRKANKREERFYHDTQETRS